MGVNENNVILVHSWLVENIVPKCNTCIYLQIELRKDDKNLINQYLFCDPSTSIEDFL
jgi:hypothetical protein